MFNLSDTIVAIATPPGLGAVAMLRLAGSNAFAIARALAPAFDPGRPREARLLRIQAADGSLLDRALVTCFAGPASFTGDDLVEFATHGGALVPAQVLAAALAAGARQALPGEFTRRAVLNGKLDLIQAEAIGDLIEATAAVQGRQALHQLDGGLSQRINRLRDLLLEAEALLAYAIDFPEEDDGPLDPAGILSAVNSVELQLARLLATASEGERVRRGALVVLAGAPNAGKSSLFNALLGRERALVTEIAGTTRDAIEADLSLAGWPVRLVDTAGLRDSGDRLEQLGIEVSQRYLREADLVLFCLAPGEQIPSGALPPELPVIVARTKSDLNEAGPAPGSEEIRLSTLSGVGLDELRQRLIETLFQSRRVSRGDEAMLTATRHRIAVGRAQTETVAAAAELERGEPVLAAHCLRQAALALEELIGVVDLDHVFDRVFSSFCVGK